MDGKIFFARLMVATRTAVKFSCIERMFSLSMILCSASSNIAEVIVGERMSSVSPHMKYFCSVPLTNFIPEFVARGLKFASSK